MLNIINITAGSIAEELGIRSQDKLISINGHEISDRLDYRFYQADENLEVLIQSGTEQTIFEIEKEADEDLGLLLPEMTMKACGNNCVFCFVYQNPGGLRKPLYFKDEDFRYSFLYGHYVTMTTLKEKDLQRIVEQRLSPLYISVHATEDKTRKLLLGIKHDDRLQDKISFLTKNGIELHAQIVLCPGINDGAIFDRTVNDLKKYYPGVKSIAVVPVGLTRHREGLMQLRMHTPPELREMIDYTNNFRRQIAAELGENFIYLADEFFIKAGRSLPEADYYDGFYQVENGVGEFRRMLNDLNEGLPDMPTRLSKAINLTWVTGTLAAGALKDQIIPRIEKRVENLKIDLVPVVNRFYGSSIEVSGLLVGEDIYQSLQDRELGEIVLLPPRVLNDDGLFLDDWTVQRLSEQLGRPCHVMMESLAELPEVIALY